jgi:hypothetical protein
MVESASGCCIRATVSRGVAAATQLRGAAACSIRRVHMVPTLPPVSAAPTRETRYRGPRWLCLPRSEMTDRGVIVWPTPQLASTAT